MQEPSLPTASAARSTAATAQETPNRKNRAQEKQHELRGAGELVGHRSPNPRQRSALQATTTHIFSSFLLHFLPLTTNHEPFMCRDQRTRRCEHGLYIPKWRAAAPHAPAAGEAICRTCRVPAASSPIWTSRANTRS